MNYDWHFKLLHVRAAKVIFIHQSKALFSRSFLLLNSIISLSMFFPGFSKKKLLQQRSHQTSDRPAIPNILMMPISKSMEKMEPYVVEWVDDLFCLDLNCSATDSRLCLSMSFNLKYNCLLFANRCKLIPLDLFENDLSSLWDSCEFTTANTEPRWFKVCLNWS